MTKDELNSSLEKIVESFRHESIVQSDIYSKKPATEGDLAELSRQVFYALDGFRGNLMKYLD